MISKDELNGASQMAISLFAALEKRKYLVQYKRAYMGRRMRTPAPVYVFDTSVLQGLLKQ
jgi:hypothetical protein